MRISHSSVYRKQKLFIPLFVSSLWVHWNAIASSFSWWNAHASRYLPRMKKKIETIQPEGFWSESHPSVSRDWDRCGLESTVLSPTACASSFVEVVSPLSRVVFRSRHGRRPETALLTSARFASSVASWPVSSSSLPSFLHSHCILCDAPFDNWVAHTELPSHAARVAFSEAFVKPERSASMLSQLKENICVDFSLIEEATQVKVQRRKRRLRSSLQYLVQQGVLHHCLPTIPHSSTTTPSCSSSSSSSSSVEVPCDTTKKAESEVPPARPIPTSGSSSPSQNWEILEKDAFLNAALVGQAYIREALTDRVARLAPRTKGTEVYYIVHYLSGMRQWSKLFDLLELSTVLCPLPHRCASSSFSLAAAKMTAVNPTPSAAGRETTEVATPTPSSSVRLTQAEKAMLLWSCIGELRMAEEKDRSHKVENSAVTEQLVHHVLVSHCLDNLLSELLHHALEKVVEECTPVWRCYQKQEELMRIRAYQSRPPALSLVPVKEKKREDSQEARHSSSMASERPALANGAEGSTPLSPTTPCETSQREAQLLALFLSPWMEYTGRGARGVQKDRLSSSSSAGAEEKEKEEGNKGKEGKELPTTKCLPEKNPWETPPMRAEKKNGASSRFGGENSSSSSFGSGAPRGLWQDVHRQLVYERPIVPVETPAASFAPFYPRLQPSSPSSFK